MVRCLGSILGALALAAPACAAPSLLAPLTISGPNAIEQANNCSPFCQYRQASFPAVGAASNGETAVLFGVDDVAPDAKAQLDVTVRAPGESFGSAQLLDTFAPRTAPAIAINDAGDTIAVWANDLRVRAAFRPEGGSFEPPVTLDDHPGALPTVGIDGDGNVLAAWIEVAGGSTETVIAARRLRATALWTAPETLPGTVSVPEIRPSVAVAANGVAAVAFTTWSDASNNPPTIARISTGTVSNGLVPSQPLPGTDTSGPVAAANATGTLAVAWEQASGVQVALRPPGATFGTAVPVPGTSTSSPAIGIDASGAVAVAFKVNANEVDAAVLPPGGTFPASATVLGPARGSIAPVLAMGRDGTAGVVYGDTQTSDHRSLQAAFRLPGGAFAPAAALDSIAYSNTSFVDAPAIAADGSGNLALAWRRTAQQDETTLLRPFDGAGPLLRGLSVPASAMAGQVASFSVAPLDVWSALAGTTWAFGDGAAASGAGVTHSFTAPGLRTVTVTATDALGNATDASATTTVTAAPSTNATEVTAAPGTGADTTAPVISAASLSRTGFRVGPATTALVAKSKRRAPTGTTIRLRLSEPATLSIAVGRAVAGRRAGGRCVKPAATRRRARRCTRYVLAGTLSRTLPAGAASVAFSGRLGRRALRRGRHRASLIATDPAGNHSTPKSLKFRIVG